MIKILVVDDNQEKLKGIRKLLESVPEIENFDTATNLQSAKKLLSENAYDFMILDLCLPMRDGDSASPENGANFLDEINRLNRLIKPFHIVGLSEYTDYVDKFKSKFEDDLWALVKYDLTSNHWEKLLRKKIDYLISSKRSLTQNVPSYQYDLAIITALRHTELESILHLPANWVSFKVPNDATEYYKGIFVSEEKKIKVVAASASQMGMVPASVLTNKIIENFRPRHIIMTGIAGGVKGVGNFGDILVTDISFDSGSGKVKSNEQGETVFEPDYRSLSLEVDLREELISCKANRFYLNEIKKNWIGDKPAFDLNIHIGPLASGAGVIQNKKIIEEIKGHNRKLIGIDMETYGVFFTATNCSKPRPKSVASFKSISDFGDHEKNDNYQKYAAYTSANFAYYFTLNKLQFE